jgi:hypothetical protein
MMSLPPEGNRQIGAAIGNWARKFARKVASRLRRALSRSADFRDFLELTLPAPSPSA